MSNSAVSFRWFCKKAARQVVAVGSALSRPLTQSSSLHERGRVRVLTYHRFATGDRDPFSVSPEVFDRHAAYLAESGRVISLDDLHEYLDGNRNFDGDAVLITMDDGFRSVYTGAYRILKEYDLPAVAYVTPSLIEPESDQARRAAAAAPESYLKWDELAEMAEGGIAVGSHAWTHRSMGTLSTAEVEDEAGRSQAVLAARLARPITSFAYPYGTRADYSDETVRILRDAGYSSAFTSQHGAVSPGMDAWALPRVKVEGGDPQWLFRSLADGGLDAWRIVDRYLWTLQARGG